MKNRTKSRFCFIKIHPDVCFKKQPPVLFITFEGLQISFTWVWTPTGEFLKAEVSISQAADSAWAWFLLGETVETCQVFAQNRFQQPRDHQPQTWKPIKGSMLVKGTSQAKRAEFVLFKKKLQNGPNLEDRRLEVRPAYVGRKEMDFLRCSCNPIMSSRLVCDSHSFLQQRP